MYGDPENHDLRQARAEDHGCSPDNPKGTWHNVNTIGRMVDAIPDGTLLLLDDAYTDLAPDGTAPPRIDPEDPGVLRFRTFSKAHGLAGARAG